MNLLLVAETEAPWGEAAENMRLQHMAFMQQASSEGYAVEGRKTAHSLATMLWRKLTGEKPAKKKRLRVLDLTRH